VFEYCLCNVVAFQCDCMLIMMAILEVFQCSSKSVSENLFLALWYENIYRTVIFIS